MRVDSGLERKCMLGCGALRLSRANMAACTLPVSACVCVRVCSCLSVCACSFQLCQAQI